MIEIDIVTPTERIVEGAKVNAVKIPSAKGELTVLPGHADLMAVLGTGILSFTQDGRERRFAVSYGFAEVRKDHVMVLAETCEESTDIDRTRAQAAQKKAQEALASTLDEGQYKKYYTKLQRAIIRQQVSAG